MAEGITDLGLEGFASLIAGDQRLIARLARGERMRATTPFRYPGRRGPVVVDLTPGLAVAPGPPRVRISDGGDLIKSLDEQGLELSADMVVSKTMFHAIKEVEGARFGSGELSIDSTRRTFPLISGGFSS